MKTYTYSTVEEFEDSYEDIDVLVEHSKEIVKAISEGFSKKVKEVELFAIDIEKDDNYYVVKAKSSEWSSALESCLRHFEKAGLVDESIDAYQLIQIVKN